jgi:hypothetical protein
MLARSDLEQLAAPGAAGAGPMAPWGMRILRRAEAVRIGV